MTFALRRTLHASVGCSQESLAVNPPPFFKRLLGQEERGLRSQPAMTASSMATTFAGGTSAIMLWTCWKT